MINPILDRRLTAARTDLAADFLRGQVEAKQFVKGWSEEVITDLADVRQAPREDAMLLTQALYGETVQVYEQENGWAFVQLDRDHYVGYMPAAALHGVKPEPFTHKIAAPRTFIYPDAHMKLAVLGALPCGARIRVIDEKGDFFKIDGEGFVYKRHSLAKELFVADFVTLAEQFHSTPYLWGGKSWLGMDCSGLVQLALQTSGREAPRDSDMLLNVGEQLSISDDLEGLQRGDLVFWKGHCGMMIDCKMLLHANGYHMQVTRELLAEARGRILAHSFGPILAFRRP